MKYEHIIWDWNGTLFDDAWLCVEIINDMLGRRSMRRITPAEYQEHFEIPVRNYYIRIGFDFSIESFDSLAADFVGQYEARRLECSLQPGARSVLAKAARVGCAQSVLSAYRHDRLEEILSAHDLTGFFRCCTGIEDHYADGKLEHGVQLMKRLDVPPSAVLLIGDTAHDREVAEAMGVDCILIPSGHQPEHRLGSFGTPVLGSLADVPGFLSHGDCSSQTVRSAGSGYQRSDTSPA